MSRADRMEQSLRSAFSPQHLEIVDESEAHRGHGGWREEGETHYRVEITSSAFNGQSRVARQRAVNQALAAEFEAGLHALSLSVEGTE